MCKILIADDEEKVCQLISKIIDWESLGIEIAGIAHDGITALNLVKEEMPDIVITDIRMPGYDGLELIAKAKEVKPDIRFIIISGYRQFDYARNAIKFGVEDYLLKPLREEELLEIVSQMMEKIKSQQQNHEEKQNMQNQLDKSSKKLRSDFMQLLLEDVNKLPENMEKEKCNQLYHCNFKDGFYQGIVIKPDISRKEYNAESYQILLRRAQIIAENIFKEEEVIECLSITTVEGIFFLLNKNGVDRQELRKQLTKIRINICGLRELFWNIRVTIGVGYPVTDFNQVRNTIVSARSTALSRVFHGFGMISQADSLIYPEIKTTEMFDSKAQKMMLEYVEAQNIDGVCKIIDNIELAIYDKKISDGYFLLRLSKEIIDVFLFAIKNFDLQEESFDIRIKILQEYHMCTTVQEIFQMLHTTFLEYISMVQEEKKKVETKPIRDAKKFIEENYAKQLRLEDIGAEIGFNATYFSALFKKETGKNFSEFLIETRVHKAKEFLVEKEITVTEAAEKVGYTDMKYFTKIFRKETGLNPSEFQKMYR